MKLPITPGGPMSWASIRVATIALGRSGHDRAHRNEARLGVVCDRLDRASPFLGKGQTSGPGAEVAGAVGGRCSGQARADGRDDRRSGPNELSKGPTVVYGPDVAD